MPPTGNSRHISRSPEQSTHKREKRFYLTTAIVLCIVVLVAAGWDIFKTRQELYKNNQIQSEATSFLLSEWISGAFREIENSVRTLTAKVEPSDFVISQMAPKRYEELMVFIEEEGNTLPQILSLGYLDARCHAVALASKAGGYRFPVGSDFSYQDFCRGLMDFPERERYLSNIYEGSSNEDTMASLVKFRDMHGNFIGMAGISFTMSFFQQWLEKIKTNELDVLAITDLEGRLLAQSPRLEEPYNKELVDRYFGDLIRNGVDKLHYEAVSPSDGKPRLIYFSQVAELPFIVIVTSDKHGLLAPWYNKIAGYLVALIMIFGLSSIAVHKHFKMLNQTTELHASAQLERRKNEEQSRFLAMLGHELKTPLAVVRMVLGSKKPTPNLIQKAERSIDEMDCIIITSQEVGRMESGAIQLRTAECHLGELLEEIIAVMHTSERIHCSIHGASTLYSDCTLIRIILSNLIENAVKYGDPDQSIEINVAEAEDRSSIELSIANFPGSAGWPDGERVFEKYYRNPKAHQSSGSGLGLYLISGFSVLIGARIHYQPTREQICFRLQLPRNISKGG